MITCQRCFTQNETKLCESMTCLRRAQYKRQRVVESHGFYPRVILDTVITCQLHVAFIGIEETEEMLEILRRPDPTEDAPRLATPQIGNSNHYLSPINRTARAVAQGINLLRLPKP